LAQTTLNYLNNRNLFSTHYLESLIKENPEWKEDVTDAFNRAKKLFNSRKESWSRMDESMLEMFLIRPILREVLGHHFVPQAKVEKSAKRPDYAFFESEIVLNEVLEKKGIDDLYLKAVAVGDAKSWKTSLDKKVKGVGGSFEFQNPSFQIDYYLRETPVQWGILTNGRQWRIYHKESSYKLDSYYEIDLVTILETNDICGFKYFCLFFRLNAFIKDASDRSFLERVKEESIAYAKKLGENLQKNVYDAMRVLSEGFFEWKDNALVKDDAGLREVQENTLKLLYRLLFIFYAESLNLLDRDNPEYKKLSLESIKYDVANKIDGRELILPVTTDYWNKLDTLFGLINEGSESEKFRIPKDILRIPAYNGGLFDPKRNPFLHNNRIGDAFIAKAIDLLAREGKDFIDYSTLGTRQLGSIYEGLLEYKLKVAEEDLVAIKEKGHERWIPAKDASVKKTFEEIKTGAIFLATDKGERKATGSYYTPDYIVKYIVRNTLGPILEEKRVAWGKNGLGERPFLHDILSIKVLDPAMGSGHFLVEACEFLANKLVEAWGEARPEELESVEVAEHDVHWARREVVRHCIFGVDLNPMAVELAKLSLWLETVAANKPLTFLDHHLKVGNSLIGAKVEDLKSLPSKEKKEAAEIGKKQLKTPTLWDFTVKKHFEELLVKYGEFAAHPDDDLKSVKQKEQEYDALQKSEINRRLHELANVWVSTYFGAAPPPDEYADMQNEMNPKEFPDWGKWRGRDWLRRAQEIAGEKHFFHWELEFPESFYEKGAPKENPGWDAVVGNPPYVRVDSIPIDDKRYYASRYSTPYGKYDIYYIFVEWGCMLVTQKGRFSYIIPNRFCSNDTGIKLRELLGNARLHVEVVSMFKVFGDASVYPVIIVRSSDTPTLTISHPADVQKMGEKIDVKINADEWKLIPKKVIPIQATDEGMHLTVNIYRKSQQLEEILDISEGLRFPRDAIIDRVEKVDTIGLVLQYQFSRYTPIFPYAQIAESHITTTQNQGSNRIKLSRMQKIIFAEDALFFQGTVDKEGLIPQGGVYFATLKEGQQYNLLALLAMLNAKVSTFVFKNLWSGIHMGGGFLRFRTENVGTIPIRGISFTTPPDRRAALVEQAKALYSAEAPDSQNILGFVGARLEAKPEESDVVHDVLAHLAEQMIDMNKKKNAEIKGFLRWLEGEIGAPVEELTNKTTIKEYYEAGFDALAGTLAKNKKKLKEGYDPTRREPKEKLQAEFNASVGKLAPLLKR
jgi:type I restriction-modification system DNA methylase subunit